jgi:transposase
LIPEAVVERAMKVQEVILRAIAKRMTWWQAAEVIGISDRQMRRWRRRWEKFGYDGLLDRRRGRPSSRRVPLELAERVLALYREKYFDFNVRHFHEKLWEKHGIALSYTWVKLALQGAGLVKKSGRRGVHRRRRPRRPLPGMLLHLDGSSHAWLGDGRRYDLLWCSMMPAARFITRNWWRKNRHARCWRRCAQWWKKRECFAPYIAIGPAIFLRRLRLGPRSIRTGSHRWDAHQTRSNNVSGGAIKAGR